MNYHDFNCFSTVLATFNSKKEFCFVINRSLSFTLLVMSQFTLLFWSFLKRLLFSSIEFLRNSVCSKMSRNSMTLFALLKYEKIYFFFYYSKCYIILLQ